MKTILKSSPTQISENPKEVLSPVQEKRKGMAPGTMANGHIWRRGSIGAGNKSDTLKVM